MALAGGESSTCPVAGAAPGPTPVTLTLMMRDCPPAAIKAQDVVPPPAGATGLTCSTILNVLPPVVTMTLLLAMFENGVDRILSRVWLTRLAATVRDRLLAVAARTPPKLSPAATDSIANRVTATINSTIVKPPSSVAAAIGRG